MLTTAAGKNRNVYSHLLKVMPSRGFTKISVCVRILISITQRSSRLIRDLSSVNTLSYKSNSSIKYLDTWSLLNIRIFFNSLSKNTFTSEMILIAKITKCKQFSWREIEPTPGVTTLKTNFLGYYFDWKRRFFFFFG